jgi:hypothetical protein
MPLIETTLIALAYNCKLVNKCHSSDALSVKNGSGGDALRRRRPPTLWILHVYFIVRA